MGVWILIAVALGALVAVAAAGTVAARRRGPGELAGADEPLRRSLTGRALTPGQRARYLDSWRRVEATFAGDPEAGLARADHLLHQLVNELGQRLETLDDDSSLASARELSAENERGTIPSRYLRRAMEVYRVTFTRLVSAPDDDTGTPARFHERPLGVPRRSRRR